jgi:hypothetical protein
LSAQQWPGCAAGLGCSVEEEAPQRGLHSDRCPPASPLGAGHSLAAFPPWAAPCPAHREGSGGSERDPNSSVHHARDTGLSPSENTASVSVTLPETRCPRGFLLDWPERPVDASPVPSRRTQSCPVLGSAPHRSHGQRAVPSWPRPAAFTRLRLCCHLLGTVGMAGRQVCPCGSFRPGPGRRVTQPQPN